MSISKIEVSLYQPHSEPARLSSYVCVNPLNRPGQLVFVGSGAARNSIASQVASTLSIEHFTESTLQDISQLAPTQSEQPEEAALSIIERAFRYANSNVYKFGHTLAAGGKTSASLLGLVLAERCAAAGKAGTGSITLIRKGDSFPFFEPEHAHNDNLSDYIGERAVVNVELATVSIEPLDVIISCSESLSTKQLIVAKRILAESIESPIPTNAAENLARGLELGSAPTLFLAIICVGPEAIYLDDQALIRE